MKNKKSFVLIVLLLGIFLVACASGEEVREEMAVEPAATEVAAEVVAEEPTVTTAPAEMSDEPSSTAAMILSDHSGPVQGAAYSPDGSQLATVSMDGTVKIWQAESGDLGHTLAYEGNDFVGNTLKFDEAGNQLALLAVDGTANTVNFHIWDANSGDLLSQQTFPIPAENFRFETNPDWQWLIAGRKSGEPELWDVATGERIRALTGHGTGVSGVSLSADSFQLMTADFDGYVQVWNMAELLSGGEALFAHSFTSPNGQSLFRAFMSGDGSRLALGWGPTVEIWDLSDIGEPQLTLAGHTGIINFMVFTSDDAKLATASDDRTARVWDLSSGEELFTFSGHEDAVARLAFSPDGRYLTTVSKDGTARIWDTAP